MDDAMNGITFYWWSICIVGSVGGFVMAALHVFFVNQFHPVLWVPPAVALFVYFNFLKET